MYRLISFQSHLAMIIALILIYGYRNTISSESISSQTWSNIIQDLSLKIHDEKIIESYPINEGFILFTDTSKKPSTTKITRPAVKNISSTTCKTIVTMKRTHQTSPPSTVDHSVGHRGRRLLNEPSYDTDIDTTSKRTPIEDENEIKSFIKVDDEELSKQLLDGGVTMDGSGDTTEDTTEQTAQSTITSITPFQTTEQPTTDETTKQTSENITISVQPTTISTTFLMTTTTLPFVQPILRNNTRFILRMNCTDANTTINNILEGLKNKSQFFPINNAPYNETECDKNGKLEIIFDFMTDNKTDIVNYLFGNLTEIALSNGAELFSVDVCGTNGIVPVTNVTSCYLINLCYLCGRSPIRGVCLEENKESKCECFANKNDTTQFYTGDLCLLSTAVLTKPSSIPSRWTPVIVGVLAGLTGLFCAITCCLWAVAIWRRRKHQQQYDLRIRRLWHLPRAQIPTTVTSENVQNYLDSTISTSSSHRTDSDYNRSVTTDSTFFKELDQKMGENLRATITRPNTQALLASLPSDTISTLSSYDPIDELDAIIDHEDVATIFHDSLNEFDDDNELFEVRNPNLKLPRPNIDSQPTGLFSVGLE